MLICSSLSISSMIRGGMALKLQINPSEALNESESCYSTAGGALIEE